MHIDTVPVLKSLLSKIRPDKGVHTQEEGKEREDKINAHYIF